MYLLQHRIKLVISASLQDIKSLSTRSLSPLNDALKLSTMFKTPLHWALKSSTQGPLALFMRHQNPLHEFLNPLYKVHRPSVWPNAPPSIVPHPSGCPPLPLFSLIKHSLAHMLALRKKPYFFIVFLVHSIEH